MPGLLALKLNVHLQIKICFFVVKTPDGPNVHTRFVVAFFFRNVNSENANGKFYEPSSEVNSTVFKFSFL